MSDHLRIIFAGTPDFAAQHLSSLLNLKYKYKIVGALTKLDMPSGRGKKLVSSPVKILAKKAGIPVFQPNTLKTADSHHWIKNQHADVMVVVAYGLILPEVVLNMLPIGCLNVHGSLLPRWRGAAPIQRSILAGDKETGITIIKMDVNLDTGDILHKVSCPIESQDTSAILYQKLAKLGPTALHHALNLLTSGQEKSEKQNEKFANYATKISKNEALIDWTLSAAHIERCIRAFNPWPVSYLIIEGQPLKVWHAEVISQSIHTSPGTILSADKKGIKIATEEGILNILKIQLAGKKIMLASDFLNSHKKWFPPGGVIYSPLK